MDNSPLSTYVWEPWPRNPVKPLNVSAGQDVQCVAALLYTCHTIIRMLATVGDILTSGLKPASEIMTSHIVHVILP